jgi:glycosyltransferase involved in cell wall biosynthesis
MEQLARKFPQVSCVSLSRNMGKSAALQVGFEHARGDVIAMMDADGQDDPQSIPVLAARLDGNADLVTGRRSIRHDRFIKRVTSRLYNAVTAKVTGVAGKDFNSGLKVMRREVVERISLYGELHRYVPVLAQWAGFRVAEQDVPHRPRLHGVTKYGIARFWRGFLDLLTVRMLTRYDARPLHLFGGLGLLVGAAGSGLLTWMLILRFMGERIGDRPALIGGVLLSVVGVQLVSTGLVAELLVHHTRRGRFAPPPLRIISSGTQPNSEEGEGAAQDRRIREVR